MTQPRIRAQDQFGPVADLYVRSKGHAEGDDLERIVALSGATAADRVLDIATGGGHTALAMARVAGSVTATDLTPEMLAAAERFIGEHGVDNVRFQLADAQALDFVGASFDITTCRIAPHHFPDPGAFVHEAWRVLRPGGRFLLEDSVVPAGAVGDYLNGIEMVRDRSHIRSLAVDAWWTLLIEAGFTVLRLETFRKRHELTDWMTRTATPPEAQQDVRRRFVAAGDIIRRAYAIEYDDDGRPLAFWDHKALFLCVK
ncbi:MAG: class I SAM-dependent methyltransferase [Dehalococcoidia bacterium]